MIRTQIYIPETLHQRAKNVATSKKKSIANLYRDFITAGLKKEVRTKNLTSLAKLNLKGGPINLSRDIDKYLYGEK